MGNHGQSGPIVINPDLVTATPDPHLQGGGQAALNEDTLAGPAGLRDSRSATPRRPPRGLPPADPRAEPSEAWPAVASRAAPGPARGRAAPGRRDATRVPGAVGRSIGGANDLKAAVTPRDIRAETCRLSGTRQHQASPVGSLRPRSGRRDRPCTAGTSQRDAALYSSRDRSCRISLSDQGAAFGGARAGYAGPPARPLHLRPGRGAGPTAAPPPPDDDRSKRPTSSATRSTARVRRAQVRPASAVLLLQQGRRMRRWQRGGRLRPRVTPGTPAC